MKVWVAAIAMLLTGAAALYWYANREDAVPTGAAWQMPPAAVEADPVEIGQVVRLVQAVGTLRANESITVSPEIAGRIERIGFDEGQGVARGALLFQLEDSVYQAEVQEKSANRALAQLAFDRADLLVEKRAASVEERDRTLALLQASEGALALARARLDKTRIHAPFAGLMGLREVSVGDYVAAGAALASLSEIDPLKVDFRVGEVHLPKVATGQNIDIEVDAFPDRVFSGTVYAIEPQVDVNGRAVIVRAGLPNPDLTLRPGLFSRVSLIVDTAADAILVPEDAIVPQGDRHFVYRIIDGKAIYTEVGIGKRHDTRVEILRGLERDAVVVTAGQLKLRDGATVRIVDIAVAGASPAREPGT
ncbi:MAG: efflux RND transporter periplasmic adaptor subunit [Gammaproteobacteria bacterium]|nr:efflux RND transporter periplasmic adaptor subunit [Gammaproteobacteria bacterium]